MNTTAQYTEGTAVTVKSGALIGGLVLRTNQPGRIIRVQQSAEFGTTYVVALTDKPGMYAYVSADGIEAVTPTFERGQQVTCKPGVFGTTGVGTVKDVIDGNVIVYFASTQRATFYAPSDLEAVAESPITVTYMFAVPGCIGRQQLTGIVRDTKTTGGERYVLVETVGRPFAEWMNVNRVQFVGTVRS